MKYRNLLIASLCIVFLVSYFSFFSSRALAAEPTTTIVVEDAKEGENGWYWEPPTVTFSCTHPSAKVYYYFNGNNGGALLYDGEPIDILGWYSKERLPTGKYIVRISYYSVLGETKEGVQSFDLKVNTVQPEIVLEKPSETNFKTTEATLEILARVVSIFMIDKGEEKLPCEASIYINNEEIPVNDETCYFRKEVTLQLRENQINITAKDASGRTKEILLRVYRYQDPADANRVQHYSLRIDVDNQKGWINDTLLPTIDDTVIIKNGSSFLPLDIVEKHFPLDITRKPMEATFQIAYNETSIQYQMNSSVALVNGKERMLPWPPFYNSTSLWIPLRFTFETLGGHVGWNAETREITVEIDL
ncbi:MAG: copper amine oxidase N-terminal domain-containing protein [Caldisericia bacterium]|nr:copper amine oxidase N-terminal domain-containing protein [Caldisericia bacterium]